MVEAHKFCQHHIHTRLFFYLSDRSLHNRLAVFDVAARKASDFEVFPLSEQDSTPSITAIHDVRIGSCLP